MFFGHISNFKVDKSALHVALQAGLKYLAETDFGGMAPGRYELNENMYALVQDYVPQPAAERKAECHERYIDIQYIVSGEECIGFAVAAAENQILEDKLAEKDAIFFKTVKDEIALIMPAGSYGIFLPSDVHRPGCQYQAATAVRKVVLKINVKALN